MEQFANFILKYRMPVIIVALLLTAVSGAVVPSLEADGDVMQFMPQNDPDIKLFNRVNKKFGGLDVPDARRLKDLESENARLKRLVAEQMLVIDGMKEIVRQK